MNRRFYFVALFLAVLAFFLLTVPANHSEAEDTYYYARMVEQGAWSEMFHQHHLLYLPVARVVYRTVQALGFSGRSLPVLIGLSMVSAAAVICFFVVLLRQNGRSRWWALPLLFSYGFWRYACAAEIYLPALAAVCAAWFFAARSKGVVGAVCCSAAALLLHLVCLPAVFSVGLLFVLRKQWKQVGLFYLITGAAVAIVYGAVQGTVGTVVFRDASAVSGSLFEISTWAKAICAFGQNLLSGNFLFSIPWVAKWLVALFSNRMLQEELFMGQQAGAVWQAAGLITFFAALSFLGITSVGLVRNRKAWLCPMTVWLAGNTAMALLFEPANPEMWIFVLLPFWFLIARQASPASTHWKRLLPVLTVAMLLHNAVGGVALVRFPNGDYCRRKAGLLKDRVQADDLVLTVESHSFVTYLDYYLPCRVVNAKFISLDQLDVFRAQTAGTFFVYGDVMNPPPSVSRRAGESAEWIRQRVGGACPELTQISENETGRLFQWQ